MFYREGNTYTNGEYTIYEQKQIGKGAYGIVFECTRKNRNDNLCAKIIKSMTNNSEYLSRESFIINTLREACPDNPNLIKVYYCQYQKFENNDVLIIIMEKCSSNLKDDLSQKQKYTSDEVLNILKQLLNGYKPLYEKSILHRDIKPENILISFDNSGKPIYKLGDFGVGKINSSNDTTITKVGTPVYAAPELNCLINDSSLDQAIKDLKLIQNGKSQVDVYSIGIMLYQFLFGEPPFQTQNPDQVKTFFQNLKHTPFKIKEPIKDINSDLLTLIEKMIVYNPKDRIKFSEIYSHKLISIQTQQPTKFDKRATNPFQNQNQNQNTFSNQIPFQNKIVFANQNQFQNSVPTQFSIQKQNLRATNPNPPQTQFNNPGPRMGTLNSVQIDNKQNQQINFQPPQNQIQPQIGQAQFTPQLVQSQFQPLKPQTQVQTQQNNQQIQIDELQDTIFYLQSQLSENYFFYSKQTIRLLKQAFDSVQKCDQSQINIYTDKLMECYKFQDKNAYSLGFLKFYYCLINKKNKLIIQRQFNNEQELIQAINNILKQCPPKS